MSPMLITKINLLDGNDKFYEASGISTDNIVAAGGLPVLMRRTRRFHFPTRLAADKTKRFISRTKTAV